MLLIFRQFHLNTGQSIEPGQYLDLYYFQWFLHLGSETKEIRHIVNQHCSTPQRHQAAVHICINGGLYFLRPAVLSAGLFTVQTAWLHSIQCVYVLLLLVFNFLSVISSYCKDYRRQFNTKKKISTCSKLLPVFKHLTCKKLFFFLVFICIISQTFIIQQSYCHFNTFCHSNTLSMRLYMDHKNRMKQIVKILHLMFFKSINFNIWPDE